MHSYLPSHCYRWHCIVGSLLQSLLAISDRYRKEIHTLSSLLHKPFMSCTFYVTKVVSLAIIHSVHLGK